ncbi:MAG TPA: prolyl oligopeptidase family serine peptidase [Prolixibacteraceae bacterium]|nr:prolyl oligopeptidase family serine peptidase [Prolixibacteraceae bacterium]
MKRIGLAIMIGMITCNLMVNASQADKRTPEKRPLTMDDIAAWQTIVKPIVSDDGTLAAFELNPLKGNGNLIVKSTDGKDADTLSRGYDARFSSASDFIVYKIKQPEDSIRAAKKKKLKKEQMPKDSLGVFVFNKKKVYTFPDLKLYGLPKENSQWVALLSEMKKDKSKTDPKSEEKTQEKTGEKAQTKADVKDKDKEPKNRLILLHPASGDTLSFKNITEFYYAPLGSSVYFIRQTKDSLDHADVMVFDTRSRTTKVLFSRTGTVKKIACDEKGFQYGFLFSTDTIKEKIFSLYHGTLADADPKQVVSVQTTGLPLGWAPSEFEDLSFSQNGRYLYFGTSPAPMPEPKDSLLEEEKPQLDIWSWKDKELQPEQKLGLDKEKKRTYKAVYLVEEKKYVQLATPVMREINTINKGNGKVALGLDPMAYKLEESWTGKNTSDYYLVEIETGNKRLILKDKAYVKLSPGGNFVTWWDPADSTYYAKSTDASLTTVVDLTSKIPIPFYEEEWDMPEDPRPYGIAGWAENDKYVFIYDRNDIWRVDMEGNKVPVNATRNYGRINHIRFRYQKLDPEEEFIDTSKPVILDGFNEGTKADGYFRGDFHNYTEPKVLLTEDYKFDKLTKSKKAEVLIWTRENVSESPNVWTGNLQFEHRHMLSEANPQQKSFVWPEVKLVHWETFSGKTMEGLLYFPENIDVEKKYPMIVYFYERNADNLHLYTTPSPSRSTVNRTFYASNDYIIFIPDITYKDGYPGQSAFDAVVSGTQMMSEMFPFIDRRHIGIQGQSWGGYQTAWLITQTDMFAAAMAGAPVANMTSAYGGIRWESGLSRMFQYEHDQSRIGGSLWEKPLQYIENSPLFHAPKINTPLLIMHNDNDGAVPWYQGIELFTAMRRLQKPAWMLTYNNEEHNLKAESWANRVDLTIRMKQFFDHYLKESPMPNWMQYGLPAIKKGKELGY